ncbi:hypothetical protein DESPIG_02166 [Desulfovibrio piger ATCC 29098]|uniref:Uncharacterized protein n=1 Tax=Desulfovibrio piger ATCC 29098 TaxID=411464 RepID=B6WVP9_9BACT|nr:hypothetical protein DESPIG_02166 [Desulfovibrio piger ATCC 29098]
MVFIFAICSSLRVYLGAHVFPEWTHRQAGGRVQTERIHRIMPWHEAGAARAEEARKNGRDRACSQWMSPTTKLFV